jgi:hypothetical protein
MRSPNKSNKKSKCKKSFILRKSYTRTTKSGKKVKVHSKCIKSRSQSGLKRSDIDRKKLSQRKRIYSIARKKFGTTKCKKGEILREGYHRKTFTRKSGSRVKGSWAKPVCIKSRTGKSSRGIRLFVLEKGTLNKYGYSGVIHLSKDEREKILKKAIKGGVDELSLIKKLNALYVLNKNINPKLANIFKKDMKFVQGLYH